MVDNKKAIIFLDIDGVLCTYRAACAHGETGLIGSFDPLGLAFLDRMCREHNPKVVIHSTWRYGHSKRRHFYTVFAAAGATSLAAALHDGPEDAWCAPKTTGSRGEDITAWLDLYHRLWDRYLIIDDAHSDEFKGHEEHLITTCISQGLSRENMADIEMRFQEWANAEQSTPQRRQPQGDCRGSSQGGVYGARPVTDGEERAGPASGQRRQVCAG